MTGGATWAVVPVKGLAQAKRRLAPVLPEAARRRLVFAMLGDVLSAVADVDGIGRVLVVTPDGDAARFAQERSATVLPEPGAGELNAAIESGIAFAVSNGVGQVLVLPGDIPLATPAELAGLIDSRRSRPGVSLAPAHDGNGTNALLLAPPDAIRPAYGPGSYLEHMSQAMARQVDVEVLHLAGVARDIDEPTDLAVLLAAAPERYAFLASYLAATRAAGGPSAAEET